MSSTPVHESKFVSQLFSFRDYMFYECGGGPKVAPLRYCINLFKGLTASWVIFLMFYFRNFSTGMYLYLFLHGSYGIAWVIKDIIFPDGSWKRQGTIGSNLIVALFLSLYWCIPIPLAIGNGIDNPPLARIVFLILMYISGLYLMLGSDYQKTKTLEKKKGLISDGFFRNTRNPNYLGQMLIYFSFCACSGNFYSYSIFFCGNCLLFSINMYLKDKTSYEKKQGWAQYRNNSYIVFPKIFPSLILNVAFYGIVAIGIFYMCSMGNVQVIENIQALNVTTM